MKKNHYLLETTSEAQEMRKNLVALLESAEETNIKLALTLMAGGGVHRDFWEYLSVIVGFSDNDELRQEAYSFIESHVKINEYRGFQESQMLQFLEELIKENDFLNAKTLGNFALKYHQGAYGGSFCLKYETDVPEKILKQINTYYGGLQLRDFGLKTLPLEATMLKNVHFLDIRGNFFSELPPEIASLTAVKEIEVEMGNLSKKSIKILEKAFPKPMAENYYNFGHNFRRKDELKAAQWFGKSARLDGTYAEAWHNEGASYLRIKNSEKGTVALLKAVKQYDKRLKAGMNFGYNMFWKACCFALLEQKKEAFEYLNACIEKEPSYKNAAKHEEDFKAYKKDKEFKKIIQGI